MGGGGKRAGRDGHCLPAVAIFLFEPTSSALTKSQRVLFFSKVQRLWCLNITGKLGYTVSHLQPGTICSRGLVL